MAKSVAKLVWGGTFALLFLGVLAGPEPADEPRRRTGLTPASDEEIAELLATRPRVIRIHLNRIGYERINEVRRRAGQPPLDPSSVRPVGEEIDLAVRAPGDTPLVQAANADFAAWPPSAVDNSRLKYFPPIRDQHPLGSCAAFATTYTQLSYMTAVQRDLDISGPADTAGQFSPKWTYNMVNGGADAGASFSRSYELLEKHGAATWAELPYDDDYLAWCLDPAVWRSALRSRTLPLSYVHQTRYLSELKELLNNGYVVAVGTYFLSWRFRPILDDPLTTDDDLEVGKPIGCWVDGREGSHAMVVVGYNDALWTDINGNGMVDTGERGGFKIANSWGEAWGEGGFVWLAYDALKRESSLPASPLEDRQYAFHNDIAYVLRTRPAHEPLMLAEFTLDHAKRDQLEVNLGRSDPSATSPSATWDPGALQNQGGARAFDGTAVAIPGSFAFDLSDVLVEGAGLQRYYLDLTDAAAGDAGTLLSFKLVDLSTDPPTETACPSVPWTFDEEQVFPYVDYLYVGPGPGENHPPSLSDVQCYSDYYGRVFTFGVYYGDEDRDAPAVSDVVIDGEPHAMTGAGANCRYTYSTELAVGGHEFFFLFSDGRGGAARAPLDGAFSGPQVYPIHLFGVGPNSADTGGPAFELTVYGLDLVEGATVQWDGGDRPTTFVSGSQLTAAIAAEDIALGKHVQVTVRNPDGASSNPCLFIVENPQPRVWGSTPPSVSAGESGFVLTVRGSGFVSNSSVLFDGEAKSTTCVSPTELRAVIEAKDIAASGAIALDVFNPRPEGGFCDPPFAFPVAGFGFNPVPATRTVTAGETTTYSILVNSRYAPFGRPIVMSFSDLPKGCTATFTPEIVDAPGTASRPTDLTVRTTARPQTAAGRSGGGGSGEALGAGILSALALSAALAGTGRRSQRSGPARQRAFRACGAAAAIWLAVMISGCSSNGGDAPPPGSGTPAGTYHITVKGTSGDVVFSTQVELKVL